MASLLIYAGALTYDRCQKSREKKRAAREAHNNLRYSLLQKDHAAHITRTQSGQEMEKERAAHLVRTQSSQQQRETCFCEMEQWDGRTHMDWCARRGRDEEGDAVEWDEGPDEGPPSYAVSEKQQKEKRGIFGRRRNKEHIVR